MTVTITRLYNSHAEARAMVEALRAANVGERNISVLASNADEWHKEKNLPRIPTKILTAGMIAVKPLRPARALVPRSVAPSAS